MNRKKFITGLLAVGAAPAATGSLLGMLPAWAAGLGMAGSSLLVVGNALRLSRAAS